MSRTRSSRWALVRPGQVALAPRVDDPRAFAVANESGRPLAVHFRYDPARHVQTVVIDEARPARRVPGGWQGVEPPGGWPA